MNWAVKVVRRDGGEEEEGVDGALKFNRTVNYGLTAGQLAKPLTDKTRVCNVGNLAIGREGFTQCGSY